jgi:hypothetical protein
VDVARPELGREAVALRVEHEEGVIADGFKVAVVRGLLLRPVYRAPSGDLALWQSDQLIGPLAVSVHSVGWVECTIEERGVSTSVCGTLGRPAARYHRSVEHKPVDVSVRAWRE